LIKVKGYALYYVVNVMYPKTKWNMGEELISSLFTTVGDIVVPITHPHQYLQQHISTWWWCKMNIRKQNCKAKCYNNPTNFSVKKRFYSRAGGCGEPHLTVREPLL